MGSGRGPHVPPFGTWVLDWLGVSPTPKTKTPDACVRGSHLKLVAEVRFELMTFGL